MDRVRGVWRRCVLTGWTATPGPSWRVRQSLRRDCRLCGECDLRFDLERWTVMASLVVRGGRPLSGVVAALGSKNAALPILAGVLMASGEVVLRRVPRLRDVRAMLAMMRPLGVRVRLETESDGQWTVRLKVDEDGSTWAADALVRQMRSSVFLLGPLLARRGAVRITSPGGCDIGARPIDFHLRGLAALGAHVREEGDNLYLVADHLVGADILLPFPSVGATENLLMAACLAQGESVIRGAAAEPEIVDLARFLRSLGARIRGEGTPLITVRGVDHLSGGEHEIIPDRIETGTFLAAAVATRGHVRVNGARADHLTAFLQFLTQLGASVEESADSVAVGIGRRPIAQDLITAPYPGFATDLQPMAMALLAESQGTAVVHETIFESRLRHAGELARMGARVKVVGRTAVVDGVPRIYGSTLVATDLRGAAALVVAGLCAEGETEIRGAHHLDRGYQDFELRLTKLGANVSRVEEVGGAAEELGAAAS